MCRFPFLFYLLIIIFQNLKKNRKINKCQEILGGKKRTIDAHKWQISQNLIIYIWQGRNLVLQWLFNWNHRFFHFLKSKIYSFCLFLSDSIEEVHNGRIHTTPLILILIFSFQMLQQLPCCFFGDGQVYMKDEKSEYGQSYDSANYRDYHDDGGLADIFRGFLDKEDDHVDDQQANREEDHREEQHEVSVVSLTDASTHEATVMVKNLYAVPASRTVACSFWPKDLTCATQSSGGCGIIGNFRYSSGKVQEMRVILSTQLEEGAFGDDSGICA